MTIAQPDVRERLTGSSTPRVAPPTPAKSLADEFALHAKLLGIDPLPWQQHAARYLTAIGPDGWLYPEVAIIVARQNGKTEILKPRILMDLKAGRRILHTAQNRTLPRQVFLGIARSLDADEVIAIRYANGQEKVEMRNGGSYTIVAPQRGARGLSADTLIFDEIREFEEFDIIAAAGPTLTASPNPQTIYLSNAGSDASVVLNDLKRRGEEGGTDDLAYLEWSASPERGIDDREGWAEANPSLAHFPRMAQYLEKQRNSLPVPEFETEHLCRWVSSMQPKLVTGAAWEMCRGDVEQPVNPALGISMDPGGKRASAVMAWQQSNGRIAVVELREATGDPISVEELGKDLRALAAKHKIRNIVFAPWTDANLAQYIPNAKPMDGKDFANASENFVRVVAQGRLVWDGAEHITDDLNWTARKPTREGTWMASKANEEHAITASLAAIRAVAVASAPKPPAPKVF